MSDKKELRGYEKWMLTFAGIMALFLISVYFNIFGLHDWYYGLTQEQHKGIANGVFGFIWINVRIIPYDKTSN